MFRGTIAHSSRAKEEAQARLELAATEVRLDSVRKQHATEEAALKLEELCKQSPVAWETLKQELGDSLSPAKRDLLKAFIKEYEGTPEGELANKESRAEGLWTLVQQYDRLKSKEKSLELANELIEQYPETIAGRLARRMIDERK